MPALRQTTESITSGGLEVQSFADAIESRTQFSDVLELLSEWRRVHDASGELPDKSHFAGLSGGRQGANLMILRPIDHDLFYERVGHAIPPLLGYDPCGKLLGSLHFGQTQSHLPLYKSCLAARQPLFSIQYRVEQGIPGVTERLMLPVRTAHDEAGLLVYVRTRADNYDLVRAIFNASQHGVVAVSAVRDAQARPIDLSVRAINAAASALIGESPDDLIGRRLQTLLPYPMWARMWPHLRASLETGETRIFEVNEPTPHMPGIYKVSSASLGDGLAITISDQTQLRRALQTLQRQHAALANVNAELRSEVARRRRLESELKELASTDQLTGIANRRGFTDAMSTYFDDPDAPSTNAALIVFDIDNFKAINDRYGHPVGDIVLRKIAEVVSERLSRSAIFGRIGGEEFAVFLHATDPVETGKLAERLRRTIEALDFTTSRRSFSVTASFGVAIADVPGTSPEDLVEVSDDALYSAKNNGRNCVFFEGRGFR